MIDDDLFDPDDESIADNETAVQYWIAEIERAEKEFAKYWEKCDKISRRYRDERDQNRENARRFNVLWSNIQTMKPAVYARAPKPIIERRFLERNDAERVAGIALQRAVGVEIETGNFEAAVGGKQGAVMDYLLFSRGIVWLRYEADLDEDDKTFPLTDEPEGGGEEVEQGESKLPVVTAERICVDYVHRKDYLCDPARTEAEVRWKAKRSWLTKRQATDKFGKEVAGKVEYRQINDDDRYDDKQTPKERRAPFWEIWDKTRRKIWVINVGCKESICDVKKDPLGLKGFWPCPKPLYGTMTDDSLVPVPDYVEYQDQAEQLDELSQRIAKISTAIKAVGFYDASQPDLGRLFEFGTDNKMIPCETWADFKNKGGLDGAVDFMPLKDLIETLNTLQSVFDQQLQRLYEVTGIADIIRGNTSPEETYGAQRIKGQFATLRLQERQREVAAFCREIVCLMTELIALHFEPETIAAMTGIVDPTSPDGMFFQQAMQLVGDARLRSFRVDIETNSTIELDVEEDKQTTVEFVTAVAQYISQILPAAENMPQILPVAGNVLLWAIRRMRTGRELESVFERMVDDLTKAAQSGQLNQQKPNPEMLKIQAQQQSDQATLQLEREKMQNDQAMAQQEQQFEMVKHQNDMQFQAKQHADQMELEQLKLLGQNVMDEKKQQHQATIDHEQMNREDARHRSELRMKDQQHLRDAKVKAGQGIDGEPGPQAEVIDLVEHLAKHQADHTNMLMKAISEMNKPKKVKKTIVRGADGRASHVVEEAMH